MRFRPIVPAVLGVFAVLAALSAKPAAAGITIYEDREAWEDAVRGPLVEPLESARSGRHPTPYAPTPGLLIAAAPDTDGTVELRDGELRVLDPDTRFVLGRSVLAFGFDYRSDRPWSLGVGGFDQAVPATPDGETGFVGVIATAPIEAFVVRAADDASPTGLIRLFHLTLSSQRLGLPCPVPEFGPSRGYPAGSGVQWVRMGDLDGDGDLDLALARSQGASVLLNNGDGTFGPFATYGGAGNAAEAIAIADLNPSTDSHLDLALANAGSDDVEIIFGNGDGTFGPGMLEAVGAKPQSIEAAELNGQAGDDLATADTFNGGASITLNNGDGTFATSVIYGTGTFPQDVALGDLDGDTDIDIAVTNGAGSSVTVLRNFGSGAFFNNGAFSAGSQPWGVELGNVDGDADNDVILVNRGSDVVSVMLNNGSGSLSAPVTYPVGDEPWNLAVGDLNGDTFPDIVTANNSDGTISVLFNNGDGTFAPQVAFPVGTSPRSVALGDLDGDTDLDVAVANSGSGTVTVLLNSCAGPPPNNFCVHATEITGETFSDQVSTVAATADPLDPVSTCGANNGNSVWYRFVPPKHGIIELTTTTSDYPSVTTVFEGGCGDATEVTCGLGLFTKAVVKGNTEYLIQVASNGGNFGGNLDFSFSYTPSATPPIGKYTVLVHGAALGAGVYPAVMEGIADWIESIDPAQIVTHTMDLDTFALMPPDLDPTKHHVINFDWSVTAGLFPEFLPGESGFSYAAGDALYAFLRQLGVHEDVHALIGYSRGAAVMSELARRMVLDNTPPDQVIYLDGEGGGNFPLNGCGGGLGYADCRFDVWGDNQAIRYDNIYSLVVDFDVGCIPYVDFGGNHLDRAYNYILGLRYRHGACGSGPPSIVEYLENEMIHDGSRYIYLDVALANPVGTGLNPDDWHGVVHNPDRVLFNGNFEWGSQAGWLTHGGGGSGSVNTVFEAGWYLDLTQNDDSLEHSFFYLRPEFAQLSLDYRIYNNDVINCDDDLKVTLSRARDGVEQTWLVATRCVENPTFVNFTTAVPAAFLGEICTLRIWKDPGGDGDLDAGARIDNVTFLIPGDIDSDGLVGPIDLQMLLDSWGTCGDCAGCPADLDGDCEVGQLDLLQLLGNWR